MTIFFDGLNRFLNFLYAMKSIVCWLLISELDNQVFYLQAGWLPVVRRRWTKKISNMISPFVPVLMFLSLSRVHCVVNKCTNEQTCVEVNKCREWCTKIEDMSVSGLPDEERAGFKKSICGFKKADVMICCEAPSESLVCGIIISGSSAKPRKKLSRACGRIKVMK